MAIGVVIQKGNAQIVQAAVSGLVPPRGTITGRGVWGSDEEFLMNSKAPLPSTGHSSTHILFFAAYCRSGASMTKQLSARNNRQRHVNVHARSKVGISSESVNKQENILEAIRCASELFTMVPVLDAAEQNDEGILSPESGDQPFVL